MKKKIEQKAPNEFWSIFGKQLKITDTLLCGFTAVLAIATIGIGYATYLLWEGEEKTAAYQLRAYVLMDTGQISDLNNSPFKVSLCLKNSGMTPAFNVDFYQAVVIKEYPLETELMNPKAIGPTSNTAVAPGKNMCDTFNSNITLTPERISAIKDGKATIYVYGSITYKDIYKETHSTSYRYNYIYNQDDFGRNDNLPLIISKDGNEQD
jgi:hypothetical protein